MDRKMQMYLEIHAQVAQSSSIRPIVLHSLPLILFVNSDASHSFLSFVLVLHDVTVKCVRTSNRHLLTTFLFPGSSGTSSVPRSIRAIFLSSDSLSLSDSVLVCFHPGFSCQASLHPGFSLPRFSSMILPTLGIHPSVVLSLFLA